MNIAMILSAAVNAAIRESYKQGLNHAWETAQFIADLPDEDIKNVFGIEPELAWSIFREFDANEAGQRIKDGGIK